MAVKIIFDPDFVQKCAESPLTVTGPGATATPPETAAVDTFLMMRSTFQTACSSVLSPSFKAECTAGRLLAIIGRAKHTGATNPQPHQFLAQPLASLWQAQAHLSSCQSGLLYGMLP